MPCVCKGLVVCFFLTPSSSVATCRLGCGCCLTEHLSCLCWRSGRHGKALQEPLNKGPPLEAVKTQSNFQAPQRAPQQLSEPEQPNIAVHSRSVPLRPAGMLLPSGCQRHLENHYHFLQLPQGICAGIVLEGSAPRQSEYQLI